MSHMKDLAIRMQRLGLVPEEVLKRLGPCECGGALSIANVQEVAVPVNEPVAVLATVCRACQRQEYYMAIDGVLTKFVFPENSHGHESTATATEG